MGFVVLSFTALGLVAGPTSLSPPPHEQKTCDGSKETKLNKVEAFEALKVSKGVDGQDESMGGTGYFAWSKKTVLVRPGNSMS